MVVCRLEAADHREKAPPWDWDTVVYVNNVNYWQRKEEERKTAKAFAEAMERLYGNSGAAKRRCKKDREHQSKQHKDLRSKEILQKATAIKEEKQHSKQRSIWVSVKTNATTNQTVQTAGRFVPIPPEATKEQTAIMISDARAELMQELEKQTDQKPTTKPQTNTAAKAAASKPTFRLVVHSRRFPDPKYLNSI